jgi:hypothetical protein
MDTLQNKQINYKTHSIISDLETPKGCFLASFFDISEKKWYDFLINQYQNDLYSLCKFLNDRKDYYYFVWYNGINFDQQIIEYILSNIDNFSTLTNLEISTKISEFGSDCIERQNYNIFSSYKEEHFTLQVLDLPRIWHFFNENKRVSLKQLEFEVRSPIIENFDIDVNQIDFTPEQVDKLIFYCHNDIDNTYTHFLYTIGETDHPQYEGKDKIKDRFIIKEEVGLNCLNWDDVKIGAEWNKKDYMEMSGRDEKDLKPKKRNTFYGKKYKTFFPKTAKFTTKTVKEFVNKIGETTILPKKDGEKKQEFLHKFNNELSVTIAKGGIHSNELPRYIEPLDDEEYIQCDVGSQYPNAMRKFGVYPRHLGKEWNRMLVGKIQRRLSFKQLYKDTKEPKYNSLQEMGKLSLNGGAYGRLNTKGDWQEDPCAMMQVTVGCQLEILMIIEILLEKGFRIVSANTDGFDAIVKKNRRDEFFKILKDIEKQIDNVELGNFEYTVFAWIAQTSVNDYIAKKIGEYANGVFIPHKSKRKDDDLKVKGDFEYYKELNKNTSFSIVPLCLQKYYNEDVEVDDFINNHKDIFDFCARSNSGSTYTHIGYTYKDGKSTESKLPKLIRYYVSKDGVIIKKNVKDKTLTNANDMEVQPAEFKKLVCNKLLPESHEEHLSKVYRQWYIDKVMEIITKIKKQKKSVKQVFKDPNQISLFN